MGRVEKTLDLGLNSQYCIEIDPKSGYEIGKIQGIGSREKQEDAFGVSQVDLEQVTQKGILLVLADGMGGMLDGEKASVAAVVSCLHFFENNDFLNDQLEFIKDMIYDANVNVKHVLGGTQMGGCTLVVAHVLKEKIKWASVGDSHIYLFHAKDNRIDQLNVEHNYSRILQQKVERGEMSQDEANTHPKRKALTSFLGLNQVDEMDTGTTTFQKGDKLLLASDGVFGTISDEDIAEAMKYCASKAGRNLEMQIEVCKKKNQDNFTAIILEKIG